MHYSIIVPVYNRPDEVAELLESLTRIAFRDYEVILVEDGSTLPCEAVARQTGRRKACAAREAVACETGGKA